MDSRYSTADITRDAVAFAHSRFGAHRLDYYREALERLSRASEDINLDRDYRSACAAKAGVYREILDYYEAAEKRHQDQPAMRRLIERAKGKPKV